VARWQERAVFWMEQVADRRESLAWYQQRCDQLWEDNRTLHAQVLRAQLLEISDQVVRRRRDLVDSATSDGPGPEPDPAAWPTTRTAW
jgi:hypothetical protein